MSETSPLAYTLENLVADIGLTLRDNPGDDGPGGACQFVEKALTDARFLETHFGPDKPGPRHIIHEDPELGFCVCVHVYPEAKNGAPHDHGPSWAIYGQAEGITEMTHWKPTESTQADGPIRVRQFETLTMKEGMAHFYKVGDVHAPERSGPVKLLRIEGANLDNIVRSDIVPE